MINRLAAKYLPTDVPAFMRDGEALDTMEYLGPEPDRWKSRNEAELSATQSPDHFLDMEYADMVKPLPKRRYDYIRAVERLEVEHPELKLTAEKIGFQPWQVEEVYQRLKSGFREYRRLQAANQDTGPDKKAILFYAGWLGHYVADGSQPLHTTVSYDGWTGPNPNGYTTAHGVHSKFESTFVTADVPRAEVDKLVAASKPKLVNDEWDDYMTYLRHSNALVDKTYQLEKAGAFNDAGTAEGKAFAEERLAAGAIELRDLIYTAWVRSADPEVEYKRDNGN